MNRTILLLLVPLALALPLLAACGGDDDGGSVSNPTPTGTSQGGSNGSGSGLWRGEFDTGTKVSIEIFVDPAGVAELAQFEEFRRAVDHPPVRYARVIAENVTGAPDTARFATLTDERGEQFEDSAITLGFACASAYRWIAGGSTPSAEAVEMYNELYSGYCLGQELAGPVIAPGATVTYFLVFDGEDEPEFARVFMGLNQEFER